MVRFNYFNYICVLVSLQVNHKFFRLGKLKRVVTDALFYFTTHQVI